MKTCSKCIVTKPESAFGVDSRRKDGLNPQCKECRSASYKAKYADVASKRLKRKYGITQEDFDQMFAEQWGCCKICGIHQEHHRRTLSVDHCHATGTVRGLLCDNCNRGLGFLNDNIERLKAAIRYLGG